MEVGGGRERKILVAQWAIRDGRVLASDRGNLAMLGLSAPVLGLIALWRMPGGELSPPPLPEIRLVSQASLVLFIVMLSLTLLGLTNAIREIVKEQPLFRRERAVGLSIPAYVLSKLLVLGAIVTVQAAIAVGTRERVTRSMLAGVRSAELSRGKFIEYPSFDGRKIHALFF